MAELSLITYQTEYDPQIGCNIPTDITFTPAMFSALEVSDLSVAAARRSLVEWENKQREKQQLQLLGMDELIAKACALSGSVSGVIRHNVRLMARSTPVRVET